MLQKLERVQQNLRNSIRCCVSEVPGHPCHHDARSTRWVGKQAHERVRKCILYRQWHVSELTDKPRYPLERDHWDSVIWGGLAGNYRRPSLEVRFCKFLDCDNLPCSERYRMPIKSRRIVLTSLRISGLSTRPCTVFGFETMPVSRVEKSER